MIQDLKTGERISLDTFRKNGGLDLARIKTSRSFSGAAMKEKAPRSKYNAKKIEIDGIMFDSIMEGKRYQELTILQRIGEISDMRMQVKYELKVNGILICKYYADFVYYQGGVEVVEDVKGMRTKEYILKNKMMKAIHNIDIFEYTISKKNK